MHYNFELGYYYYHLLPYCAPAINNYSTPFYEMKGEENQYPSATLLMKYIDEVVQNENNVTEAST